MLTPHVYTVSFEGEDRVGGMRRLLGELSLPANPSTVAIKLNLCDYRLPESGAVSHPEVVGALLHVLRERFQGAAIYLCENDSSDTLVENMWGWLGIAEVAERYGAKCVSLSQEEWLPVALPGRRAPVTEVPRILAEADLLINHPKLKTHGKTKITCSLKNMFGCYRPKDKRPYHAYLDEAIVDINLALRPHVTIVDADICVEGNRGPCQGLPKRLRLFVGGADQVAVDAFCARLMGFRRGEVRHIVQAEKAGLGSRSSVLLGDFAGTDLRPYHFKFSQGKFLIMNLARRVLSWSDAG